MLTQQNFSLKALQQMKGWTDIVKLTNTGTVALTDISG